MDAHVANPLLPKIPEESLQALADLFLASLGDLSEDYSRLTQEQMAQAILNNWDEVLEDHPATDFKAITSLKRKTMKNTVIDHSSDKIPNPQTMRLHMGELTGEEVLVAQSAYRLALAKDPISEDTVGKLIQILERAQEGLKELARFADEHGSCSSHALEHVAADIARVLASPEVRFIPRKALSDVAQYPTTRRRASPW